MTQLLKTEADSATRLEPGLLPTFRIFVAIRFVSALFSYSIRALGSPAFDLTPMLLLVSVETAVLFLYLYSKHLQKTLQRAYLPIGLALLSLFPVIELLIRNQGGWGRGGGDAQLPILTLLTVIILIAWQYSIFHVLAYCALSALVVLFFLLPGINLGLLSFTVAVYGIISTLFFLGIVGFVVNRLVTVLQAQRTELSRINEELNRQSEMRVRLAETQERNRLATELHDVLAHSFSALAIELEAIRSLWYENPNRAYEMLQSALQSASTGLDEARRAVRAIRAKPLETLGLPRAIQKLAKDASERGRLGLLLDIEYDINGLRDDMEQAIYRVAGEAIANTLQHARANNLAVALKRNNGNICLTVSDDGRGFRVDQVQGNDMGLQGMRMRAEKLGGRLDIRSTPPNGALVELNLPEKTH